MPVKEHPQNKSGRFCVHAELQRWWISDRVAGANTRACWSVQLKVKVRAKRGGGQRPPRLPGCLSSGGRIRRRRLRLRR